MRGRRSMVRVLGAAVAVLLFTSCEAAVEVNAGRLLAPDSPAVDEGLRTLARAHSQDGCDAGQVLTSADPEAAYGPGSIELTDREPLDPALEAPKDDHKATSAIWRRLRTDPRLDDGPWARMAAGETLCDDGYLYMTLVLQSDGEPGWASGVERVTAGNGITELGGISADGTTVAIRSRATDLVPGTTATELYLYDVEGGTLDATGIEPEGNPGGTRLSPDGTALFYNDLFDTPLDGRQPGIGELDVASGTSTVRVGPFSTPTTTDSVSADGSVLLYRMFGAGSTEWGTSLTGPSFGDLGEAQFFEFDASVSDDGRVASIVGGSVKVFDRTTSTTTTVVPSEGCFGVNGPANGTGLSAEGRYLAYSCGELRMWDQTTGTSTTLTPTDDDEFVVGGTSISDDGRFVAYSYGLLTSPRTAGTYLWDRTTDESTLIAPVASEVAVSGDGSTVAFTAVAPDQTDDSITDLYVWDNPAA